MQRRHFLQTGSVVSASVWLTACGGGGDDEAAFQNSYAQRTFVATNTSYQPEFAAEPLFADAWGIAIRPAGAGGHFWVLAQNVAYEYVGDVNGTPLSQDSLKKVTLPGPTGGVGTGIVYNGVDSNFVITQAHPAGAITAGAKFLFAADSGVIQAWTERKNSDGTFDRPDSALIVVDQATQGSAFFGLAVSPTFDRLYAADFGSGLRVQTFDKTFNDISATVKFTNPFAADPANIKVGDFTPFNVQVLASSVFVTYAQTSEHPAVKGQIAPASEVHALGAGKLAEFDLNGKLIAIWDDGGKLNAPWGVAIAPANFGGLSNTLLVANFGEGTIVAFDRATRKVVNYLRGTDGAPVVIAGIWSLLFGNGVSLGDSNALYYAGGPEDEAGGVFGALRYSPK